ncbi:IS1380 family transposase, partial [Paenarthrobacter sp. Z7-10]|uniref:IS1380 family transposase n=1 Tax=Paenarthrobacter sp. Z7-10 TaxID=2787635 RepID=UPI0022A9A2B1
MKNSTGFYPGIGVDGHGTGIVSQAGAVLLTETAKTLGLPRAMSQALAPWGKPFARHDPGKILLDQALSLAMGGDCLADVDRLRTQPGVFGPVASAPTVSRLIRDLGADNTAVLAAINAARARIRARAWEAAGDGSPVAGAGVAAPVVVDLDASLVTAHSEKENAKPTYKKGFGLHPLAAFVDHGADGTGEPLAMLLRPGNAGSNTAADHIKVTEAALAQLPDGYRSGHSTMIRTDSAGGTHEYLAWLTDPARNLAYSVGFGFTTAMEKVLPLVPENGWTRAYNSDGFERDGAWIADITGMLDLSSWPAGLRVIVRKEIPHPGAQLRITDIDGMRSTAFATNQAGGQLADLEVRHRLRARCEDRIRISKDTGLANLPLAAFASNEVWVHLVMLAVELTAWTQMLALTGTAARRWEPKRLRARIFETAGRIVHTGRRFILHLAADAPE